MPAPSRADLFSIFTKSLILPQIDLLDIEWMVADSFVGSATDVSSNSVIAIAKSFVCFTAEITPQDRNDSR